MGEGGRKPVRWRPWLRALHRDFGYVVVGLTIIYALSGLAVNHIGQWDPNFEQVNRTHALTVKPLPADDAAAARAVLQSLDVSTPPKEVFRLDANLLDVVMEDRTFHVDAGAATIHEEGQEPRFLLRVMNWLHLNRGKAAWTYIADGYAVLLLFLALSGIFMLPGKKGIKGRGALLVGLGIAVPILYVTLSGGP